MASRQIPDSPVFQLHHATTLGYGDFTGGGSGARAIAVLEALFGQVFLATLVARLVSAFRAPAEQALARRQPEASGGSPEAVVPPQRPPPEAAGEGWLAPARSKHRRDATRSP